MSTHSSRIIRLRSSILNQLQSQVQLNSIDSIIRELFQNSIDANADEITLKIDLKSLSVYIRDNGLGISPDELELVSLKNYTSKLAALQDLKSIETFGFKGEALHSLSTISNLNIVSKCKSHNGSYSLQIADNKRIVQLANSDEKRFGRGPSYFEIGNLGVSGTVVTATNIFANMPVRKEQIHNMSIYKIIDAIKLVILQSLIQIPNIKLSLLLINHEKLQLDQIIRFDNKSATSREIAYSNLFQSLFGIRIKYEPVKAKFKDIEVFGIIGTKPINTKAHQYLFLNNRPFVPPKEDLKFFNSIFSNAGFTEDIDEQLVSPTKIKGKAFHKFPFFLIRIDCVLKTDILFQDPSKFLYRTNNWTTIKKILEKTFARFLVSHGHILSEDFKKTSKSRSPSPLESPSRKRRSVSEFILHTNAKFGTIRDKEIDDLIRPRSFIQRESLQPLKLFPTKPTPPVINIAEACCDHISKFDKSVNFNRNHLTKGSYRIIKQIDKKFILMTLKEDDDSVSLVILDQHACDERIKVEQMFQEFVCLLTQNPALRLSSPHKFDLSSQEIELFIRFKNNFQIFGIVYDITDSQIQISHLPFLLLEKVADDSEFLKNSLLQHCYDLMNHVKNSELNIENWFVVVPHLPRVLIEIINSKACRSAIMFGDELSEDAMAEILEKLSTCKLPFQCAHGRPSIAPLTTLV
ncbi:MLH3 [[Candida] subhashii]|uniref:MLH3 n=1 Tax=[Candida] subhashii TaxID=561895 RepID=A0A8J5QJ23_9ASCO|nr:MLH3 [[Candida] subhashii]KAG7663972.1 MLH3 [[Candida] subhashii]